MRYSISSTFNSKAGQGSIPSAFTKQPSESLLLSSQAESYDYTSYSNMDYTSYSNMDYTSYSNLDYTSYSNLDSGRVKYINLVHQHGPLGPFPRLKLLPVLAAAADHLAEATGPGAKPG